MSSPLPDKFISPPPQAGEVGEHSEPGGGLRLARPLPSPPPKAGEGKEFGRRAGVTSGPPRPKPDENKAKRAKRDVHGWLVLDKPVGMTSTHAVSVVKRLFSAKRAGHAGTLDPLASGCLPIALGEATKTVMYVMDGRKHYHFTVRWGEERDTDDAEGRAVATSETRPSAEAIRALLPRFHRHDRAGSAAFFRHQDRGRAGL